MIAIGYCRVSEWDSDALSRFPCRRREMLARITHPVRFNESASVTALLLHMLAAPVWGEQPRLYTPGGNAPRVNLPDWPVGPHGQPFPDGIVRGDRRLFVSLSHGGGFAAAALCDVPVGIDLQPTAAFPPAVAARCGWPLEEAPALWAAQEAAIKLRGGTLADLGGADFSTLHLRTHTVEHCLLAVVTEK